MWDGGGGEGWKEALSGKCLICFLGGMPYKGWSGVRGAHWGGNLDPIMLGSLDVGQGVGVTAGCGIQGTQYGQSNQSQSSKI